MNINNFKSAFLNNVKEVKEDNFVEVEKNYVFLKKNFLLNNNLN